MNPGRLFDSPPATTQGPPPPRAQGPVFAIHNRDLLAEVDPHADPALIDAALARAGMAMRSQPDRPLASWLRAWRIESFDRHEVPFFGMQARYADGRAARLGVAPRSAAGPDLRWGLLRDAHPEMVEVPVVRRDQIRAAVVLQDSDPWSRARALLRDGWRPQGIDTLGTDGLRLTLMGDAARDQAAILAERLEGQVVDPEPPSPKPPALATAVEGCAGATAHHRLGPNLQERG